MKHEINKLHIPTSLSNTTALIAEISGYKGQEDTFGDLITRRMRTADIAGLMSMIEEFNAKSSEQVEASDDVITYIPFNPIQIAVGN